MGERMKLMLCVPHQVVHFEGVNARAHINVPLGILSIAAYLRAKEWSGEIEVYDARLSAKLSDLGPGRRLFGDSEEEVAARIEASAPDVVGITNMFSSQIERALRTAEIVKRVRPNAVVVVGGPHVSVFPHEVLAHPAVDYVVMGEGEERMLALLDCLEKGIPPAIPGVLGRPEDDRLLRDHPKVKVDFIQNVDELPLPAYDLADMPRYFHLQANGFSPRMREFGQRSVSIITSRGCPHHCIFCSIHATMGYRWRSQSAEYVRRHIQLLRERYDIDFIHFEDDNLTHDPARFDQLLDILLELKPTIPWDTPNGVRGDTWTAERVRRVKQSGCQYLAVAIESGVQRVLDQVVRKRLDLAQVDDLLRYARNEGLRMMAFYVVGLPGERLDEIDATFNFALSRYFRYGVWPGFSLALPLPGTEMNDIAVAKGWRDPNQPFAVNQLTTDQFDPEAVNRRFRRFLRLRMAIFVWRSLTSWRDMVYQLKMIWVHREVTRRQIKRALRFR